MNINRREMLAASAAALASPMLPNVPSAPTARLWEDGADIWGQAWTPDEISAAGFGFNIPAGATIKGVQAVFEYVVGH